MTDVFCWKVYSKIIFGNHFDLNDSQFYWAGLLGQQLVHIREGKL